MADSLTNDIFSNSVTANDMSEYKGNGVVNYVMPWYLSLQYTFALPTDLPPDWAWPAPIAGYWTRDIILRQTPRHEAFWSGAIAKAAAKQAAKSFEVKGNRVERYRQLFVEWGGDGYVPSQKRTVRDYMTTNNGAFVEIVRASAAYGSRVIGLVHLDSLRVIRTGDPETPYVFVDLKGQYHGLHDEDVIALVDMPNTAQAAFGRGTCAADDVYDQIYKCAVMNRYLVEKVTGAGANVLDFITGVTDKQLENTLITAQQDARAKGQLYYQGHIIQAILAQVKLEHVQINLRELPDGFDREKELQIAQLAYAVRLGLDPQDLNPALVGHGALGTGAQSVVLHEKQEGSVLATYEKELVHQFDQKVLPDKVSFAFSESDIREQLQKAQIVLAHAQARQIQVANGEINAQEARQLAIEAEDMPADIQVDTMADEAKPTDAENAPEAVAPGTPQPTQPVKPEVQAQPVPSAQGDLSKPQEQKVETALERLNLNGIQITSAMGIVHQVASGDISRDQGINALQILLNLSEEQASRLMGDTKAAAPVPAQKEIDALLALKESIDAAREEMKVSKA